MKKRNLPDDLVEKIEGFYRSETETDRQLTGFEELIARHKTVENGSPGGASVLFSVPGRTELAGNHTDHNHGRVLTGSINLDTIAIVSPLDTPLVRIDSLGYPPVEVDLSSLKLKEEESGKTDALVRGIAAGIRERGGEIGGFRATTSSRVLKGSGLSSSAAVEILIGTIFNNFYNKNRFSMLDISLLGRYAENHYFGKPCGLMDQLGCSLGGISAIDFRSPEKPEIESITCDFSTQGYTLSIVATGSDHADLTSDYATIAEEMKRVAGLLGVSVCRELSIEQLIGESVRVRRELGDRAWLRAYHFLDENRRVGEMRDALSTGDIGSFLALVNESGRSSLERLQNGYSITRPQDQDIPVALTLTEEFLREESDSGAPTGAWRLHGGGFAGAVQVYIPTYLQENYTRFIEKQLGEGCVHPLSIRQEPAGAL